MYVLTSAPVLQYDWRSWSDQIVDPAIVFIEDDTKTIEIRVGPGLATFGRSTPKHRSSTITDMRGR
jgi:hypothetical protein